jgi:hypothetical protein
MKVLYFLFGFLIIIFSYGFHPAPVSAQIPNTPIDSFFWNWYDCLLPSASPPAADGETPSESTELPFNLPLALKTRFPFDLIYPINPLDLPVDTQCMETSLWGIERQFCAPMQIAGIAKNVFLFSYVLRSLMAF